LFLLRILKDLRKILLLASDSKLRRVLEGKAVETKTYGLTCMIECNITFQKGVYIYGISDELFAISLNVLLAESILDCRKGVCTEEIWK